MLWFQFVQGSSSSHFVSSEMIASELSKMKELSSMLGTARQIKKCVFIFICCCYCALEVELSLTTHFIFIKHQTNNNSQKKKIMKIKSYFKKKDNMISCNELSDVNTISLVSTSHQELSVLLKQVSKKLEKKRFQKYQPLSSWRWRKDDNSPFQG
jgi:TPP-dependent 2-oxoacid decarboxylase